MLNILGINISTLSKKKVLNKIQGFLRDGKSHYIVTPNPEIILKAKHDEELFYILNQADLVIPDGIGLKFASWLMGKNIQRITGADLVCDILKIAENQKLKVGIFNWKNSLSSKKEIEKTLKNKYPKLNFKVFVLEKNGNWKLENAPRRKCPWGAKKTSFCHPERNEVELRDPLNKSEEIPPFRSALAAREQRGSAPVGMTNFEKFDIALVALGAPYQEKFIYHNLVKSQKSKVKSQLSVGIGGSLDFLTNKAKRAPKLMRFIGLEWLWRLIQQPSRLKRIYNATIKFSFYFLRWRFILPFLYRPNVVCMLYKKENNKYKILLAEREDEPGHWQLPQGGTDGETLWQAGARELREEIDCDKFKPIAVFKNLWKYKFSAQEKGIKGTEKKEKIQKHLGYMGQKQGLFIAKFLGKDSDITINFWDHRDWKWVNSEDFVKETHKCRQGAAKVFLEKFVKLLNG